MDQKMFEMVSVPPDFDPDEMIFYPLDEDGNRMGDPYSYNEWFKMMGEYVDKPQAE